MSRRGKGLFSVGTLFASFFGAAMIAGAFAYFNYKFSEFKFVNFDEWVFYTQNDLFKPDKEIYIVLFYSSKQDDFVQQLQKKHHTAYPVIAIDYYQQVYDNTEEVTFLRSGTNTVLKFIQRFNVYEVPTVFLIKKTKDSLYKQDSMIRKLKDMSELAKRIE